MGQADAHSSQDHGGAQTGAVEQANLPGEDEDKSESEQSDAHAAEGQERSDDGLVGMSEAGGRAATDGADEPHPGGGEKHGNGAKLLVHHVLCDRGFSGRSL